MTYHLPPDLANAMTAAGMWKQDCPVPLERLAAVPVRYFDFAGIEHDDGELVALDVACRFIAQAFDRLHSMRFPIAKIRSVHHYAGSDDTSMADNNTSCFNHRPIEGTSLASLHSYGLAVDLNPLQNPFVVFEEDRGIATIHPSKGWEYLNRHNRKPGMVEEVVQLWAEAGFFIWGGRWTTPIDYHHFQTPRGMAELLLALNQKDGDRFFEMCISNRERWKLMPAGDKLQPLVELAKHDSDAFFASVEAGIARLIA